MRVEKQPERWFCGRCHHETREQARACGRVTDALIAVTPLIMSGDLMVWDPSTQQFAEVEDACKNGCALQLNINIKPKKR